jgi:hypothetical protein
MKLARILKGSTYIGISDLEEDMHPTKNYAQLTFLKYYTSRNKKTTLNNKFALK